MTKKKRGVIMGAGGIPSRGESIRFERRLNATDKPNSKVDRYNQNGILVQSRWYDGNGKAVRNRDYIHQNAHDNHFFPHDHSWTWNGNRGTRNHEPLLPDYENYK